MNGAGFERFIKKRGQRWEGLVEWKRPENGGGDDGHVHFNWLMKLTFHIGSMAAESQGENDRKEEGGGHLNEQGHPSVSHRLPLFAAILVVFHSSVE